MGATGSIATATRRRLKRGIVRPDKGPGERQHLRGALTLII